MEPQVSEQIHPQMAMSLVERMARVETAMMYERSMTDRLATELRSRISFLERLRSNNLPQSPVIGWDGWIKILIALLMPLVIFGLSGSAVTALLGARRLLAGG